MTFFQIIDKLRDGSQADKDRFTLITSISITFLVAVIWISFYGIVPRLEVTVAREQGEEYTSELSSNDASAALMAVNARTQTAEIATPFSMVIKKIKDAYEVAEQSVKEISGPIKFENK